MTRWPRFIGSILLLGLAWIVGCSLSWFVAMPILAVVGLFCKLFGIWELASSSTHIWLSPLLLLAALVPSLLVCVYVPFVRTEFLSVVKLVQKFCRIKSFVLITAIAFIFLAALGLIYGLLI